MPWIFSLSLHALQAQTNQNKSMALLLEVNDRFNQATPIMHKPSIINFAALNKRLITVFSVIHSLGVDS